MLCVQQYDTNSKLYAWSGGIPQEKKTQTKPTLVHAYIIPPVADAIHASARKI